jgi:Zn finger protein HypA/HybF involved in hydrogenase expression
MGERQKAMVRCVDCEEIYTGWNWPDKSPKIVGKACCPCCESEEFTVVDTVDTGETAE